MIHILSVFALIFAVALASPALAAPEDAPPPKKKPAVTRHVKNWTTPPGYRSPEQLDRQDYEAYRRDRAFARRHNTPQAYFYYYNPNPYYYSGRFASNRFDARSGPCWTQTPIGAVWNCGK